MSTNYEFIPAQDNPLSVYGSIHLGKSSAGWKFGFHGYKVAGNNRPLAVESGLYIRATVPALWVVDISDVVRLISGSGKVVNEYGSEIGKDEFLQMIADKAKKVTQHRGYPSANDDRWQDSLGNDFSNYEFS